MDLYLYAGKESSVAQRKVGHGGGRDYYMNKVLKKVRGSGIKSTGGAVGIYMYQREEQRIW